MSNFKTNAMAKTNVSRITRKGNTLKGTQAVLERIQLKAAGVDIGSEKIFVAVLDGPVVEYDTFTSGILQAVNDLKAQEITTVAMEATGIYWFPIYDMFTESGLEVYVVNGGHVKNVPGRKTDVLDAEWLRELHTYGLLRSSFIPEDKIRILRYHMRLRSDHITMGATHVQHIQKNLDAMNLKLHNVISDIIGQSGLLVLKAILQGERDSNNLLKLCHPDIQKKKAESVIKSLEGNFKEEYLFGLKQALQMWEIYQAKIQECDKEVEKWLQEFTQNLPLPDLTGQIKSIQHNKPAIDDLHKMMLMLVDGKDATRIAGINDYTLLQLVSEVGLDLKKWPTSKHFTAWTGLAPSAYASGKMKKRKTRKVINRAGQIFRQIAMNVGNGKHIALSGFYKRIRSKSGASVANKATARKIAVYYYDLMTKGIDFVEEGLQKYEQRYKTQMLRNLNKRAKELGMQLTSVEN
jgi:transposase